MNFACQGISSIAAAGLCLMIHIFLLFSHIARLPCRCFVFCKLYARLLRQVNGNIARWSFGNIYARLHQRMQFCFGKSSQMPKTKWSGCQLSVLQALCKVILASIWQYCRVTFWHPLLKATSKSIWQYCHATFLQSLSKFALAGTCQPIQMPSTTFIGCQVKFFHP